MSMQGAWNHFGTITRHRHLVIWALLEGGIFWQGLRHDLSKYSPTEFLPGARYYQGNRSPNEKEREVLGYSVAWMHHKGRNKHHFEYWNDYNPKEMGYARKNAGTIFGRDVCDRLAASKVYAGDQYQQDRSLRYFQNSNARKRGMLHPETEAKLMELLEILAQQGEEAAFAAVRELVKKGY